MAIDCREAVGGMPTAYVIEHANVTAVTISAGVVTAITKASGKRFWKYQFPRETAYFKETVNASLENGTLFFTPEIMFVLHKMQANTSMELTNLAKNILMVVVADGTGKYFLVGYKNGMMVSAGESGTGTAMGDRNGYSMTLTGGEPAFAYEVQASVITSLETPGT